jgi:hypothetical protein
VAFYIFVRLLKNIRLIAYISDLAKQGKLLIASLIVANHFDIRFPWTHLTFSGLVDNILIQFLFGFLEDLQADYLISNIGIRGNLIWRRRTANSSA